MINTVKPITSMKDIEKITILVKVESGIFNFAHYVST